MSTQPTAAQIADWQRRGPMHQAQAAYWTHKAQAEAGEAFFRAMLTPAADLERGPLPSVYRIAARIAQGFTVEEAAAREYLYRWRLTLQSPIFGAPHALGM